MERKKKRITKAKLLRAARGSISILLCLLITPFLTVTLGIMEYARYQQLVEISNELIDLVGISQLADYDTYIHDRFGLLAVSQESELGDGLDKLFTENAKSMGQQITQDRMTVTGISGMTFMDTGILKKQLVDVSELTATAAVITKDAKLEELLDKLNGIQAFTSVMDTVDDLAEATKAVTDAVKAAKKLKEDIQGLQQKIAAAKSKGEELAEKFGKLYEKLGSEGITLPENATPEQIQEAVSKFKDTYLDDIKELYTLAKEFKDSVDQVKGGLNSITTDMKTLKDSLTAAKNAINRIGSHNEADEDGSISAGATNSLEDILEDMEDLVDDTLKDIKDTAIDTAKGALDEILDYINESTGLVDVVGKYSRIVNGDYFKVDEETHLLSKEATDDIVSLLKAARKIYDSASGRSEGQNVGDIIKETLVGKFVPDLSQFNFGGLMGKIQEVLDKASNELGSKVDQKLNDMFDDLGNLASKIFRLTFFYDDRLNSTVSFGNAEEDNPNERFIHAVEDLLTAVDDFMDSADGLDIIGMLEAMWDLLVAIKDMISAIIGKIGKFIESIGELFSNGATSLYERFVISGYMRHNLPCRVNAGDKHGDKVDLSGKGLTGFDYGGIARSGNNTFKGAELEYIYAGTTSEIWNQTMLFWDMYFLRLLLDLPSIFRSTTVSSLATAANVAAWAVYLLYIIIEPFLDTLLLVNGQKVALLKKDCWMTPLGIAQFGSKLVDAATECDDIKALVGDFIGDMGDSADGGGDVSTDSKWEFNYETHTLLLLALLVGTSSQVQRLSNIIDMETKQYYADSGMPGRFSLGKTYVAVKLESDITYKQFFDLGSEPSITLDRVAAY